KHLGMAAGANAVSSPAGADGMAERLPCRRRHHLALTDHPVPPAIPRWFRHSTLAPPPHVEFTSSRESCRDLAILRCPAAERPGLEGRTVPPERLAVRASRL